MPALQFLSALLQIVIGVGLAYHYGLLLAGGQRRSHPAQTAPDVIAQPVTASRPKGGEAISILRRGDCFVASLLAMTKQGTAQAEQLPLDKHLRFAVAIPAHNEASVIGATIARLLQMDYPRDRFDIHIVADYCNDNTAEIAQEAGAIVHRRQEGPRGRKGYALQWLVTQVLADPRGYEAIAIFDADSQVCPDFLKVMNQALLAGAQAAQGKHMIANPGASVFSALADADMRINNRIRNQAKENLGLSARLMGDGMCFAAPVLQKYPWVEAASLTEDRGYGIYLVTRGLRVRFVPQAVSLGQAAMRWRDATGQRLRWYGGGFDLQKRYLWPLLKLALGQGNWSALDLALELALPPFSTLAGLALLNFCLVVAPGVSSSRLFWGGLILLLLACAYPSVGLLLERAPLSSFFALLYGPFYVAWRIGMGFAVRLRRGQAPWTRTRRAEELDQ